MDTIVAQATALVAQPIGIVRISGPKAHDIAQAITKRDSLNPREAHFLKLYEKDQVIDHGVVIYFKAPHSFTGEDVVEMQAHGSIYALSNLISVALTLGARLAEPGEFSKRAFLNGKMSLDQVEAVADLISSNSQRAAKSAVMALEGGLGKAVDQLQSMLMNLRVLIEAEIDFSEEDIPSINDEQIKQHLLEILKQLNLLLQMCKQGVTLQNGIKIALVGAPNAGKSTLMNRICQKDVSIVTKEAGTTRDVVARDVIYKGVCLHFLDTAGLRETNSLAEKAGIERSYAAMSEADLVLYIKDTNANQGVLSVDKNAWIVDNKVDLLTKIPTVRFPISAQEDLGIDVLLDAVLAHFQLHETTEQPFSARKRHVDVLNRAKASLPREKLPLEMLAVMLQQTQDILSEITGEVSVDDVLGKLFSDFCVGK